MSPTRSPIININDAIIKILAQQDIHVGTSDTRRGALYFGGKQKQGLKKSGFTFIRIASILSFLVQQEN